MRSKRKKIPTSVGSAILLIASICFMDVFGWRDYAIYYNYQRGNIKTVTSDCSFISIDHTNEPVYHGGTFTIYSFHLSCGTTVAVYSDSVESHLLSTKVPEQKQALERQFVTGRPYSFTYVTKPALVGNTCALVSVSDSGELMIDGVSHYSERFRTIVIVDSIAFGLALLSLTVPLLLRLYGNVRRKMKKVKRKSEKM